jgi:zinc protease
MQKIFLASLSSLFFICSCSQTPVSTHTGTAQTNEAPSGIPNTTVTQDGKFDVIPLVGDFLVKRVVLPNGLRVDILKDSSSPTFAYNTWFRIGSRNEVVGKTGLAHLFEHMMFKGTTNHKEGEFDALLEQAGVEGENAFTSNDHTVYVQELPKDKFDLITSLESDRMVNLVVDENSFKTEREVVQNERRFRKENSPEGTIYQSLFELAFTQGQHHWPVIGYEQDLNLMSAQDARDFYQQYYGPDRATVVVVGDVDENDVLKRIEKTYGSIKAKNTPDVPIIQDVEQTAQRRMKIPLSMQVEKLWMAYKIPGAEDADTPVFEILQGLLTDGMNSRLNKALVDSGIAGNVGAGSFNLKDPGLFAIMVDLQKGKTSILAETIVNRELERLKNSPVRDDELKRTKNLLRFHFYQRLSSASGKANFIGESETQRGSLEAGLAFQRKIQEVTPEMIQAVATKYFDSTKLTVVVGVPKAIEPAPTKKSKTSKKSATSEGTN